MRWIYALVMLLLPLPALAVPVQELTSPGGQDLWLVEDHALPFVAVEILFRGGASLDLPGKRGAAYLMTATLEEGAGDLDARGFAEAAETLGAAFSFDIGDDTLSVSARMLSDTRAPATDLLALALTSPDFAPDAVARVRSQITQAIAADQKDPGALAGTELAAEAWGAHPYGSDIKGSPESLAALTPDDLREIKARIMTRDHAILSVVGDVTPDQAMALADRLLGALPDTGAPLPDAVTPGLTGGITVIDWDSPQSVVLFAQEGLALDDPDYIALMLANHILGGPGFSARLMDELREKRGLTYGVSTWLTGKTQGDLWQGGFSASNDKVAEAVALLQAEWARLARDGVSAAELSAAKTYLTGAYPLRFDGNGTIAGILSGMQLVGLEASYIDRRNALIEAVTAEDIARVAARIIRPDGLRIVIAGRPTGLESCGAPDHPACAAE